jgi:hypothetical protein
MSRDYKKYGTEFDLLDGKDFDILSLRSFSKFPRLPRDIGQDFSIVAVILFLKFANAQDGKPS